MTFILVMAMGWNAWRMYTTYTDLAREQLLLWELIGTITYMDEALTMSAHMFAITGDSHWEERYNTLAEEFDVLVPQAVALAPEAEYETWEDRGHAVWDG